MGLIKYLITEGKKDVIVNKIGLPPNIAEFSLKFFNKKFVLYWTSTLKNLLVTSSKKWYEELSSWDYEDFVSKNLITYFKMLEVQMKNPKTPRLSKKILNRFKNKKDFGNISEEIEYIESLVLKYQTIKDYAEATNQNFNNDDFETISEEAEQWHEELRASGKKLQVSEEQTIIKKFDDGYYWVDLNTSKCYDEGDSMGHCGNTSADTLLSLRDEKGEPHVTVAYNYDGTFKQMKGKGNKKPVKKYHPYIVELFIEPHSPTPKEGETNEIYQIIDFESEYTPFTDFNIFDLNDKLFDKVISEVDEQLIKSQTYYAKFYDIIKRIEYDSKMVNLENVDLESSDLESFYKISKMAETGDLLEIISDELDESEKDIIENYDLIFMQGGKTLYSSRDKKAKFIKYLTSNKKLFILSLYKKVKFDSIYIIYGEK